MRKFILCQIPAAFIFPGTAFLRVQGEAWVTCTVHKAEGDFSEAVGFKETLILSMAVEAVLSTSSNPNGFTICFPALRRIMKNIAEGKKYCKQ